MPLARKKGRSLILPRQDQIERLALLLEEAGEVVQAVGKIQRHGYTSRAPGWQAGDPNNRNDLEREIGNFFFAVELACKAGDISRKRIEAAMLEKKETCSEYLHFQDDVLAQMDWD